MSCFSESISQQHHLDCEFSDRLSCERSTDADSIPDLEDLENLQELALAGDDEPVDQALPRPDDIEADEPGEAEFEPEELEQSPADLYEHWSKGHQPYMSNCMSCVRALGKIPARRLQLRGSSGCIGADFTFLGPLKLLTIVAFAAGFLGGLVMSPNSESNTRC